MRVLVQWTRRNPRDWEEADEQSFRQLPNRGVPAEGTLGGADNAPGWVFGLNVQGVHFDGHDHYAVEPIPGGCRVYAWSDDPGDGTVEPFGSVWEFLDPAPDPAYGGLVNTRQTVTRYGPSKLPFAQFPTPDPAIVRHGVWVTDERAAEHQSRRTLRGWREWIIP